MRPHASNMGTNGGVELSQSALLVPGYAVWVGCGSEAVHIEPELSLMKETAVPRGTESASGE